MASERWRQIEELYHLAREQGRGVLADVDPGIRSEVESLLQEDSGRKILDQPAAELLEACTVTQLAVGDQLGRYKVEAPIGAGGMGQVYRARDTLLGRVVSLKVSTKQFGDRFDREARAISALNHPHVCTLYDVGPNYLVMEFVEGETLEARLRRGKLAMSDVAGYGTQIAEALAEAHAKGITHRDLKPGNIMLTKSGVKVLDFGLAKIEGDGSKSNAVMGTLAYMAPEQMEGKEADARTDIYALGLVLREMATGRRGTDGEVLPPQFAHVIERCLAQEPHNRWQTARDVRAELDWAAKAQSAVRPAKTNRRWQWIAFGTLLLIAIGAAWVMLRYRQPHPADEVAYRLELQPPENGRFVVNAIDGGIALSPDGKSAAYFAEQPGKTGLWIRPLDGTTARLLPGTEGASFPFWSPDNQSVGSFVGSKLVRSDVSGGPPVPICEVPSGPRGGAWSEDGRTIVFGTTAVGLWQVPAAGGTAAALLGSESSRGGSHFGMAADASGRPLALLGI